MKPEDAVTIKFFGGVQAAVYATGDTDLMKYLLECAPDAELVDVGTRFKDPDGRRYIYTDLMMLVDRDSGVSENWRTVKYPLEITS